jgi:hypothetical protein
VDPLIKRELLYQLRYKGRCAVGGGVAAAIAQEILDAAQQIETLARVTEERVGSAKSVFHFDVQGIGG